MTFFDVFNGDADGICALHQLRLAQPRDAVLVTGVKRDTALLQRLIAAPGDDVTVLDIPLDRNRGALLALLQTGVQVRYFDHHHASSPLPQHPLLQIEIDVSSAVCTSIIVDRLLGGRYRSWAVVAAFGDNLLAAAARLASTLSVPAATVAAWRDLGECLNYNAYGGSESDLVCSPAELYRTLAPYEDAQQFIEQEPVLARIRAARTADMVQALACAPEIDTAGVTLHQLPDAAWARRVIGSFANHLATSDWKRAHAVLVPYADASFSLSLRVPQIAGISAAAFCRRFGGGGRRIAGGCDGLPPEELPRVSDELIRSYPMSSSQDES